MKKKKDDALEGECDSLSCARLSKHTLKERERKAQ